MNRIYLKNKQFMLGNIPKPIVHYGTSASVISLKDSIKNLLILDIEVAITIMRICMAENAIAQVKVI